MDQKLCNVDYAPCFLQGPLPLKRGELLVNEHAAQCGVQVPSPCSLSVRAGRLRLPALLTHALNFAKASEPAHHTELHARLPAIHHALEGADPARNMVHSPHSTVFGP